MQGKGILFVWEDALFRVKWDLIDEELFDPERVDDLSARLNWLLWSGQRFSLSCAHVLTDCFGGLLQTGKLSFKWISHKDLTDYCLAESIGTPLN